MSDAPQTIDAVEEEQARQEIVKGAHEQLDEAFAQRAGECSWASLRTQRRKGSSS